jgi:glycosyltransferase involved in cell wall biosynthesis
VTSRPGHGSRGPRVVAILAVHNEARFIASCIGQLVAHGIEVYLLDNGSTDETVQLAEPYLDRGLIAIEAVPRGAVYAWRPLLMRKQALAASLDADWFLHVDADEVRLPPRPGVTLREALATVDRAGFNAVDFQEFTFVPTRERPDHDHPQFRRTMQWYYPFRRRRGDQVRAWKRQSAPVDLVASAGHHVEFPGLRVHPEAFPLRHYLFLSVDHAVRKYVDRAYDPEEVRRGWHTARARLRREDICLLGEAQLRRAEPRRPLDASDPWRRHPLFSAV